MDSPSDRDKKGTETGPEPTAEETAAQALAGLSVFWNQLRVYFKTHGSDLDQRLTNYAKSQTPHSLADLDELCGAGCDSTVLGFIFGLIDRAQRLDHFWATFAGKREERSKPINALSRAADALDDLWSRMVRAFIVADLEAEAGDQMSSDFTQQQVAETEESVQDSLSSAGRITPQRLASELRLYASLLTMSDFLIELTGSRSPKHFARYILSAYVRRATGKFRDRNVASILADMTRTTCTADDQRVWRDRYYDDFDSRLSGFFDQLVPRKDRPEAT